MNRIQAGLAAAVIATMGCGGAEEPPSSETKAPAPPQAAMMPDSMMPKAADSGISGTMTPAGKAAMAPPPPLRDSAFGPKFAVDSTGKVTPIKPPE